MAETNREYEENYCEFEEGDIYAEGFGLVASLVMRDKSISTMAKAIYAYLMTFSNRSGAAWPSTNRILEEMNLSRNSFYKYRSELRDAGFLDWTTFGREGGGRRTVYKIFKIRNTRKEFSTNPRSEQYPKICAIASGDEDKPVEMWKTNSGKPTNSPNFGTTNSPNFGTSTYNKPLITNQTTTTSTDNDPHLRQSGTATAEPVVSGAPAPRGDLQNERTEEDTRNDTIHKAFVELEARSMRRTKSASVLADAEAIYRKLVEEGNTPRQISAAYSRYQAWVLRNNVKHVMGLASWLESDNGFKLNSLAVESARGAEGKQAPAMQTEGDLDAAEYRKRSQAVGMIDDDAEYRVEFAEQSDDEHLRHLAATIRAEKPVTLSNGLVDDRLSERPSYVILWSRTNKKDHRRDYVLWAYEKLKTEGKVH